MKLVTIIISLLFSFYAKAQTGDNSFIKPFNVKPAVTFIDLGKAKLIHTNNNNKVYALPLDGMPCLVPNIKEVAKIPNGSKYPILSRLGNPFKKHDVLPPVDEPSSFLDNNLQLYRFHKKEKSNNPFLSK
ncbi:MAG: hypothetical protein KF825_11700 [Ferruginibacter sp.]|nr:hypothetical protein [Ferruginibacter sp.]